MGLAFSKQPISSGTFVMVDASNMVSQLNAYAVAAGWSGTPISGGYDYVLTSPQAGIDPLRVKIWESSGVVHVQARSYDELRVGVDYTLQCDADADLFVWMNCCQWFIAWSGISYPDTGYGNNTCGGIPFVAELEPGKTSASQRDMGWVDGTVETITECWWTCGGMPVNFRWSFNCYSKYDGCTNGDLRQNISASAGQSVPSLGHVSLIPLTPCWRFGKDLTPVVWFDDEPLPLDPWICWGESSGSIHHILQGILWDAVQFTTEAPLEDVKTWDGFGLVNYLRKAVGASEFGDRSFYVSLYLVTSVPATGGARGSYAY